MRQWMVMYRKELLEMWRSGKWLWVPVVSILLCVMNPVTSYYMPEILDKAGNLPEGTILQIPVPTAAEVMTSTLSQFGMMGILILVLASMGIVSAERTGGVAAMILVKPVHHFSYISAKWAGVLTLAGVSFLAGYASAWYYTELLIGHVDIGGGILAFGAYGLWLAFVLTVTVLMSTLLRGGGAAAFVSLFIAAALSLITGLLPRFMEWSPGRLPGQAGVLLQAGEALSSLVWSICVTLIFIVAMLLASARSLRLQELSE
jgi:ABC-2 type transport system permease protein